MTSQTQETVAVSQPLFMGLQSPEKLVESIRQSCSEIEKMTVTEPHNQQYRRAVEALGEAARWMELDIRRKAEKAAKSADIPVLEAVVHPTPEVGTQAKATAAVAAEKATDE